MTDKWVIFVVSYFELLSLKILFGKMQEKRKREHFYSLLSSESFEIGHDQQQRTILQSSLWFLINILVNKKQ